MKYILLCLLIALPFVTVAQCSTEEYQNLLKEAKSAQQKGQYDLAINKLFSARVCRPERDEEIKVKILAVFEDVNKQRKIADENADKLKRQRDSTIIQRNNAILNAEEAKKQRDTATIERINAFKNAEEAGRQRDSATTERNNAITERIRAEKKTREVYANDLAFKSQIALERGDRSSAFRLAEITYRYVDDDNPNVTRAFMEALYNNDDLYPPFLPWSENLIGHYKSVNCVAFSSDGKWLASASIDRTVKLWNKDGKNILTLLGHEDRVWCVAFSPDAKILATGSCDGTAKLWNVETGKELLSIRGHPTSCVLSIAFSPDGKHLATGAGEDRTVKIWEVNSGKELFTFSGHENYIKSVAFSPDGKLLATGSRDETVIIWDIKNGKNLFVLRGHEYDVTDLAFSPNGELLASASGDITVKIWDIKSRKELKTLIGHESGINSVAFSLNGKLLATGSDDKTVKIWDVETWKELLTLRGHTDNINSVAFSSDGKLLASGSDDKTVKIWNLEKKKELLTMIGHKDNIHCVAFSSDGNLIASGSADAKVEIWGVKSGKVQRLLHAIKYEQQQDLAVFIGQQYAADLLKTGVFEGIDLIVPIPLHTKKLKARGFNQSESFATGLAEGLQKTVDIKHLKRPVETATQTRKRKYERWENVEGIFSVEEPEALYGKHILLVDDVVTTGATIEAAWQALKEIPDVKVSVASIAFADKQGGY